MHSLRGLRGAYQGGCEGHAFREIGWLYSKRTTGVQILYKWEVLHVDGHVEKRKPKKADWTFHALSQKGPKKTLRYFLIAFELSIVFCSPWKFFLGPFLGEGVI